MEQNKGNNSGWGGSRQGAGRKKTKARYYGFRATREVADILEAVEGSKSDFINGCILRACGRTGDSVESGGEAGSQEQDGAE